MFTEYTGNRQFDLPLNRYLGPDAAAAWRLYFLAAFYLPEHDQRKRHFIDAASRHFDASHTHLAMRRHTVPY